jgi:hypothetical protein
VPREPFDALENLPKEAPRQVAFGGLQDKWHANLRELSAEHFVSLAIAFLGLTGHLRQFALRLQGPHYL